MSRHVHPEGRPYFSLTPSENPSLQILTEDWVLNSDTSTQLAEIIKYIEDILAGWSTQSALEAFIQLEHGGGCGYYLVNHSVRTVFWLNEVTSYDIDLADATSMEQRDIQLEELYWIHVEHFPMHLGPKGLGRDRFDALICVLAHGRLDQLTSRDSTFSFTAEECGTVLEVLIASKDHVADGNVIWIYGHHKGSNRFLTFYDDKHARVSRSQVVRSEFNLELTTKSAQFVSMLSSLLSFNVSWKYLLKLNDVFVDRIVYQGVWKAFISGCIKDWTDAWEGTTICLLFHAFLFPLNANATLAAISAAILVTSFITAKILLHCYDSFGNLTADEAREYLQTICSPTFKFQFVALTFSLPRTLQIWGLLVLLANFGIVFTRQFSNEAAIVVSTVAGFVALAFIYTLTAMSKSVQNSLSSEQFFENMPKQEIFIRAFGTDVSCNRMAELLSVLSESAH
ncbi:hypothetical protein B0H11DRAFT_2428384 [Mycena galericulata]|nr:hypothetical protein B0H11DRAFT_2428384 [Mycena galericulata]